MSLTEKESCAHLTWADVDIAGSTLSVRRSLLPDSTPKTRKTDASPATPDAAPPPHRVETPLAQDGVRRSCPAQGERRARPRAEPPSRSRETRPAWRRGQHRPPQRPRQTPRRARCPGCAASDRAARGVVDRALGLAPLVAPRSVSVSTATRKKGRTSPIACATEGSCWRWNRIHGFGWSKPADQRLPKKFDSDSLRGAGLGW